MSTTAARRRALRTIILRRTVTSQAELVELLEAEGFAVTQATVSRDLHVIGAAKADGDHYVIGAPPHNDEAATHLARAVDEFVESIQSSANLVVLHTAPGAAQVVAAAIDQAGLDGVIGTVAGDDTILVVCAETTTGRHISDTIERMGAET